MKLLIVGAQGQLGLELSLLCEQRGLKATCLGRSACDIGDRDLLDSAYDAARPTVVINAAAYTNVDKAESEPELAFRTNRDGAANLARTSSARNIPLIHVSTDYVYDGMKPAPYLETDTLAPLGIYGMSKVAGEAEVRRHLKNHIIVRTSWVYGRFGKNFLKTMLRLADTRDSWGVVNDQVGTPTVTTDLAVALIAAAEAAHARTARWGTYHFAGRGEATWYEFACAILANNRRFSERRPEIFAIPTTDYPTPARRPANSRLNSDLFAAHFGVTARSWQEGVSETVEALSRS